MSEDLYTKVIDIAQEQARSTAAMTELHRQNVTKLDTMSALLSAQTSNLVGISAALGHMAEERRRADVEADRGRESAVEAVNSHITTELDARFRQLMFWREPKFWLAIIILALSNLADVIPRLLSTLQH